MDKSMALVSEALIQQKQRRSERTIPFLSGEEVVLIGSPCHRLMIAKMLDLSEDGTLVYLSDDTDSPDAIGTDCKLTLYHRGEVFEIDSKVARRARRLVGFEFINPSPAVASRIRAKIVQMADWMKA